MLYNLSKINDLTHCNKLKINLIDSLSRRFKFLEKDNKYAFAAILTPKFGKRWCSEIESNKYDSKIVSEIIDFLKIL